MQDSAMRQDVSARFMPLPPAGVLIDTCQPSVTERSGFQLERMVDALWSRRSLFAVPYPGTTDGPVLVAFHDGRATAELGLVLRPVDASYESMPVVAQLAAILVRLLEQRPRPTAALVEVALAMRIARGDTLPATRPAAGGRKLAAWQSEHAVGFMDARLADGFTTADVAAQCGMSVARFSLAFRLSFGVSIRQWVIRRRVALAQQMLVHEGVRLETVAAACGFKEQCHFTRQFGRLVGVPPGAWRRQQRPLTA